MSGKIEKRSHFLINVGYITVVALIVYLVFKYMLSLIMPFILAFLIASAVIPLIRKINSKIPRHRKLVSFLIVLLLYIVIFVLIFSLIMALFVGVRNAAVDFSENYWTDVLKPGMTGIWNGVSEFIDNLPIEWQQELENIQSNLMKSAQNFVVNFSSKLLGWVSGFTARVPGFIIAFIFTILLSFFVTMQYDDVTGFISEQLPDRAKQTIYDLNAILKNTVLAYVGALFILMIITSVELFIGLKILGKENALLISLSIAILDALPVFGTGTVLIPWAVLELIQGNYRDAVGIIIIYGVISLVRNIIEPKVVGDRLGINPIVSIMAIYFGFKTFGVFGMIFMPMVVQILLELHKRGSITIFRRKDDPAENTAALVTETAGAAETAKTDNKEDSQK